MCPMGEEALGCPSNTVSLCCCQTKVYRAVQYLFYAGQCSRERKRRTIHQDKYKTCVERRKGTHTHTYAGFFLRGDE
jgi:hypothetical protein